MSKCGFLIVKNEKDVLYPKRTKYSKYLQGRCSRGCKPVLFFWVSNKVLHNLVLEDMALKVYELVVFHIEPLKQRAGL